MNEMTSTFTTIKQADGRWRWVAFSSNTYRDRDGEYISQKALEEDVDRADASGYYGPLAWWHLVGSEYPDGPLNWETWRAKGGVILGDCDFNMMAGRILVESGTFRDEAIAEAIQKEAPNLQISLGFSHPPSEPDGEGVFHNIHRYERSILPAGKASNPLTQFFVKGADMASVKEKIDALVALLKDDSLAEMILQQAEAVQKEADAAGVAHKEADAAGAEAVTEPVAEQPGEAPAETEAPAQEPEPEPEGEEKEFLTAGASEEVKDCVGDMPRREFDEYLRSTVKAAISDFFSGDQKAAALMDDLKALIEWHSANKEKEAKTVADVVDAQAAQLARIKELEAVAARVPALEKELEKARAEIEELSGSRPRGIKELHALRASESEMTVVQTAPAGPQIDPSFIKFAQGGN